MIPRRNPNEFSAVDTYMHRAETAAVAALVDRLQVERFLEQALREAGFLPESDVLSKDADG